MCNILHREIGGGEDVSDLTALVHAALRVHGVV